MSCRLDGILEGWIALLPGLLRLRRNAVKHDRIGVFCLYILTFLAIICFESQLASAIQFDQYAPERHDRFYSGTNRDFIGESIDWSGVARNELTPNDPGDYVRWATMISDTHFLTAHHAAPAVSNSIDFYPDNDLTSTPWTGTVASSFRIADSDFRVGKLAVAPPSWVKRYPLLKRPSGVNHLAFSEVNPDVYVVGRMDNSVEYQVGLNTIEELTYSQAAFSTESLRYSSFNAQGVLSGDEATAVSGDSGAPVVSLSPAGASIVGTNSSSGLVIGGGYVADAANLSPYIDQIVSSIPESVVVATDLTGDINADYRVNGDDYNILAFNFGASSATYSQGDLDADGDVDGDDYNLLAFNFGTELFSSADFNQDAVLDTVDFAMLGVYWNQSVAAGTNGDVNLDGYVDGLDIDSLNDTWRFAESASSFPLPTPPFPVTGDVNNDGLVNGHEYNLILQFFGQSVTPGENGDYDGNGIVDASDYNLFAYYIGLGYDKPQADVNQDGKVDSLDMAVVTSNYNQSMTGQANGDINSDGIVDSTDFEILGMYWGYGHKSAATVPSMPIPEPTTCALTCMAWMLGYFGLCRHGSISNP